MALKSISRLDKASLANLPIVRGMSGGIFLIFLCVFSATSFAEQAVVSAAQVRQSLVDENGYRIPQAGESEFDNQSESYVKDWRDAVPKDEYQDTVFGDLMYNEASVSTKLEVLRLLSKDTPSAKVFMTAVSMGIDIESVLEASVKYAPNQGRDFAASAANIAPLLRDSNKHLYTGYDLEDLERDDESIPYSVEVVAKKFFEERQVLRFYPDWFEGQFHFMALAAELKRLQEPNKEIAWYKANSIDHASKRPIFVSLYESNELVLIDGGERVESALESDPKAELPVVVIFNSVNERPLDDLGYPLSIRGVKDAYIEKGLMLTPAPEWQLGEHHFQAKISEFYEFFNIPDEEDFEPQAWQKLLDEARKYSVADTSFLVVMLQSEDDERAGAVSLDFANNTLLAAWDNPRTESAFPYVAAKDGQPETISNILKQGVIVNRPDLIAALNALGVEAVPVAFYYFDPARTAPYGKNPQALIDSVTGAEAVIGTFVGGGTPPPPTVVAPTPDPAPEPTPTPEPEPQPEPPEPDPPVCASPPCTE